MNLKDSTLRTTKNYIDALITEQWVTFHVDDADNKDFVNQTAGMRQFCSFSAQGLAHSTTFFTSAQLLMRRTSVRPAMTPRTRNKSQAAQDTVQATQHTERAHR